MHDVRRSPLPPARSSSSVRAPRLLVLLALGLAAGCATDGGLQEGEDGSEPGGPRFLSFGTNRSTLTTPSHDLIITAVLTDGDGVDDIIGGTLSLEEPTRLLGSFATAAQEGAYGMTLTWPQLLEASDAEPDWDEVLPLTLRATFFDQAGHEARQTTTVTLDCSSTPMDRRKIGPNRCSQGAVCKRYTPEVGPMYDACQSNGEQTTGHQMCQRAFGRGCESCGERSCSDTANNLSCNCL